MTIISNYKDYYDFLQGKYGIDPKVVYERICFTRIEDEWKKTGVYKPSHVLNPKSYSFHVLAICGTAYYVYFHNGQFVFSPAALISSTRDTWHREMRKFRREFPFIPDGGKPSYWGSDA